MKRMMLRTTLSFRLNQMKKVHLIETPIHSNNSEMDQLVVDLWVVALVLEDHLIETIILSNSLELLQLMVQLWLTRPQGNHHLRLLRPQRPLRLDLRQLLQVISNQQRASMFWLTASRLLNVQMRVKASCLGSIHFGKKADSFSAMHDDFVAIFDAREGARGYMTCDTATFN